MIVFCVFFSNLMVWETAPNKESQFEGRNVRLSLVFQKGNPLVFIILTPVWEYSWWHSHTHAPFFLYWVLVTWGVYVHDGYPHRDFFFFYFRFFFVRLVYRSNAIRLGEAVKRLTTSSFYFQGIIVTRGKLPPFLTSTTSLRSPIFGCCQQRPLILTLFVCW